MKKIINGKKYDTETAQHIANEWNGLSEGDFNWFEEDLYKKKTGEFFLYGKGGAMSKYSKSISQNTWSGGSKIIPLCLEEAKLWVQKYCSGDKYEEIFGEVEE